MAKHLDMLINKGNIGHLPILCCERDQVSLIPLLHATRAIADTFASVRFSSSLHLVFIKLNGFDYDYADRQILFLRKIKNIAF